MVPVIRVENLSKQYQIGLNEGGYTTLREAIVRTAKAPIKRLRELSGFGQEATKFWALSDVSFDVHAGESIGIIGPNGAGKSTLLKILSRIAEPTRGRAEIRGRVGSLLEVGTGFHSELTGRENVFLNGAILGMGRREIMRKFDDIVEFSGVGKFLDTPVKRYSTGMKIRLGFAVAAHLEPEIMIVDEVLAVGDAEFQKKCLGKMEEVGRSGRTVLFVSHNMAAIEALCTSAVLLRSGRVHMQGDVEDVIAEYLSAATDTTSDVDFSDRVAGRGGKPPLIRRFRILDNSGDPLSHIPTGSDACFELDLFSEEPIAKANVRLAILSDQGHRVFVCNTRTQYSSTLSVDGGMVVRCHLKNCRLVPERYRVEVIIRSGRKTYDEITSGIYFDVTPRDLYGTGRIPKGRSHGVILPEVTWECHRDPAGVVRA